MLLKCFKAFCLKNTQPELFLNVYVQGFQNEGILLYFGLKLTVSMYTVCSISRFVSLYSKYFRFKAPSWWEEVKLEYINWTESSK